MADHCLGCGASAPRALRDAKIEEAFDARAALLSCAQCLTVQRGDVVLAPGSSVVRACEALERASAEGRLSAELMRISRARETWPVARVPELFSACGFRIGAPVRAIADNFVLVERRNVRMRDLGEGHVRRDWAVVQRIFAGKWNGQPGESSEASLFWQAGPDQLGVGAVMTILALEPPALVLEPQEAWMQTNVMPMLSGNIKSFRAYADAVAPFDIQ